MGELHTLPLPAETPGPRYRFEITNAGTAIVLDQGKSIAACFDPADAIAIADAMNREAGEIWIGIDLEAADTEHLRTLRESRPADAPALCFYHVPSRSGFTPIVLGAEVCKATVYADTAGARRMIDLRAGAERSAIRASIRAFRNGVQALMIRLGFTEAADDAFLAWELMTIAEAFHRDTELGADQRRDTLQRAMRDLLYFDGYSFIAADDAAIGHLTWLVMSGVGFGR